MLLLHEVMSTSLSAVVPPPPAVQQRTQEHDEDAADDAHHQRRGHRVLPVIGGHDGQQVGVFAAHPNVARVTRASRSLLQYQKAAGAVEAEAVVGVRTVIELRPNRCCHKLFN